MVTNSEKVFSDYASSISIVQEYLEYLELNKSHHTIRSYIGSLDRFLAFIDAKNENDILSVDFATCRNYQAELIRAKLNPSSINAHTRTLKVFYNWLVEIEKIVESPFKVKSLKPKKREKISFTAEEIEALLTDGCQNMEQKTIIAFLLSLGLRRAELVNLKYDDIRDRSVNIIGKGDKYRKLYMPENVYRLYSEYAFHKKHEYPDCEFVFNKLGHKYSTEAIRLKVKAVAKRAGIDEQRIAKVTPHVFRRTFVTNLIKNNVNMRIIQGAAGHANMSTTLLYADISDEAIKNAMGNQEIPL